jgi:GTPase SAR1 family protein
MVGTFSSGKSTLINRLVGEELLPSGRNVTTRIPVEIRHRSVPGVGTRSNGVDRFSELSGGSSISGWIRKQQQGTIPQTLERLLVGLYAWPFDPGVSLIDTPGFDSEDPTHRTVVERVLRDVEVAVVVVEPRGLSDSAREFIAQHIARRVPNVVFIINQLDLVDDDDQVDEILERTRIHASNLGLSHSKVIGCSAKGYADPRGRFVGWTGARSWIADVAEAQVRAVVAARVARELEDVISDVVRVVRDETSAVERALQEVAAEKSKQNFVALRATVAASNSNAQAAISRRADAAVRAIEIASDTFVGAVNAWVHSTKSDITESDVVTRRLASLHATMEASIRDAFMEFERSTRADVAAVTTGLASEVAARWEALRRKIDIDGLAEPPRPLLDDPIQAFALDGSSLALPSDFGSAMGGATLGALIGSIVPGLGTIVGGAAGAIIGWMLGSAREEAAKLIRGKAFEVKQRAVSASNEYLKTRKARWQKFAADSVDGHAEVYLSLVEQCRSSLEERSRELARRNDQVRALQATSDRLLFLVRGAIVAV